MHLGCDDSVKTIMSQRERLEVCRGRLQKISHTRTRLEAHILAATFEHTRETEHQHMHKYSCRSSSLSKFLRAENCLRGSIHNSKITAFPDPSRQALLPQPSPARPRPACITGLFSEVQVSERGSVLMRVNFSLPTHAGVEASRAHDGSHPTVHGLAS